MCRQTFAYFLSICADFLRLHHVDLSGPPETLWLLAPALEGVRCFCCFCIWCLVLWNYVLFRWSWSWHDFRWASSHFLGMLHDIVAKYLARPFNASCEQQWWKQHRGRHANFRPFFQYDAMAHIEVKCVTLFNLSTFKQHSVVLQSALLKSNHCNTVTGSNAAYFSCFRVRSWPQTWLTRNKNRKAISSTSNRKGVNCLLFSFDRFTLI